MVTQKDIHNIIVRKPIRGRNSIYRCNVAATLKR